MKRNHDTGVEIYDNKVKKEQRHIFCKICSVVEGIGENALSCFHYTLLKIFCEVLKLSGNLVPRFRYFLQLWAGGSKGISQKIINKKQPSYLQYCG